jgi:hypothetical protein
MWYWTTTTDSEYTAELELSQHIHYRLFFIRKSGNVWEIDYWPISIESVDDSLQKQIDIFSTGSPNAKWPFSVTKLYKLMLYCIIDFIKNVRPKCLTAFTQIHREPQKKLHILLAQGLVRRFDSKYITNREYDIQAGDIERVYYYL